MNNGNNLVSVGIPCYNKPKELERLLEQVLNQSHKNLEILISNNCSADPEVDSICREAARVDSRIKYFRQSVNIGPLENHHFLLRSASSSLFLFLGDDDEINENYIEYLLHHILSSNDVSLVGPRGLRIEDSMFQYEYDFYTSRPSSAYQRLSYMLPMAFDKHWAFEQYWYGLFRVKNHPSRLSGDFKSTLCRLFWLAEQGEIVYAKEAVYTKCVTSKELIAHRKGSAYRRHKILKPFRDDHVHSLQQCLPITLQMNGIILRSLNLSVREKASLLARLYMMFVVKVVPCELRLEM